MNDYEFLDHMKEIVMAPDSVVKKAYIERLLKIIAEQKADIKGMRETIWEFTKNLADGTTEDRSGND